MNNPDKNMVVRSLRFPPELDRKILQMAEDDQRSFANMVVVLLTRALKEQK